MGTIVKPTSFTDNTIPTAAQFNGDFDTIYAEFNGAISNANIASNAGIAVSKLVGGTDGQYLTSSSGTPQWGNGPSIIAPTSITANDAAAQVTTSGTTELTIISKTITNPSAAGQLFLTAVFNPVVATVANDVFLYRIYLNTTVVAIASARVSANNVDHDVITLTGVTPVANSGTQILKMTCQRDATTGANSGVTNFENGRQTFSWLIFSNASTTV